MRWHTPEALEIKPVAGNTTDNTLFNGKTVVLTGTLSLPRIEAKRLLKSLGARVTTSVSGNTDYVIAGDNPGSKVDEAERLQVTVLDEQQFLEMADEDRKAS